MCWVTVATRLCLRNVKPHTIVSLLSVDHHNGNEIGDDDDDSKCKDGGNNDDNYICKSNDDIVQQVMIKSCTLYTLYTSIQNFMCCQYV